MLEQMVSIVEEQKPDVFLLCGDVYHTPQPSAAVQTMLSDGLVKIHEANPQMTIVMTAGNHDSGTKHEIFQTPWKALKVYAIGQLEKTASKREQNHARMESAEHEQARLKGKEDLDEHIIAYYRSARKRVDCCCSVC